jgi:hypothetical protein
MTIEAYAKFWLPIAIWIALAFGVIAIMLLGLLLRQIVILNRARRIQADAEMLAHLEKGLDSYHRLYDEFCASGFAMKSPSVWTSTDKEDVRHLVRSLNLTGILLHSGVFDHSPALSVYGDVCIRSCLMLEKYVESQRQIRQDPVWLAPFQYLTVQYIGATIKNWITTACPLHSPSGTTNQRILCGRAAYKT